MIGFRVLTRCLQEGYRVRIAVRSLAKKDVILAKSSLKSFVANGQLSAVIVPDITQRSAFDDALQGVAFVVHVAAPIVSVPASEIGGDLAAHYSKATTEATRHLLESARAHGAIKRVILTNSLAALIDHVNDTEDTIRTEATRAVNIQPAPYNSPFEAYVAAKVSTLNQSEQWYQLHQPVFDLVHMVPGHVFGPNELMTDPAELIRSSSNRMILAPIVGGTDSAPEPGVTIHLDDVAEAHVRALNVSNVPGNRLYILSSGGIAGSRLDTCFDIVARHFPEAVEEGVLKNNGSLPSINFKVDARESARLLGMEFMLYEQQVKDTVAYYLTCLTRRNELVNVAR
jgi:nucleoside-diphosphate-sugar epimerase